MIAKTILLLLLLVTSRLPAMHVTIAGPVYAIGGAPELVELPDDATILDALAAAGGVYDDGEPDKILVSRFDSRAGKKMILKVDGIAALKEPARAFRLVDGDSVWVSACGCGADSPQYFNKALFEWEYWKLQGLPFPRDWTAVAESLHGRGDVLWGERTVRYPRAPMPPAPIKVEGPPAPNSGERPARLSVEIGGAVYARGGNVGMVDLPDGATILDALAAVGGAYDDGAPNKIRVSRRVQIHAEKMTLDVDGVQALKDPAHAFRLMDGDLIWVGQCVCGFNAPHYFNKALFEWEYWKLRRLPFPRDWKAVADSLQGRGSVWGERRADKSPATLPPASSRSVHSDSERH